MRSAHDSVTKQLRIKEQFEQDILNNCKFCYEKAVKTVQTQWFTVLHVCSSNSDTWHYLQSRTEFGQGQKEHGYSNNIVGNAEYSIKDELCAQTMCMQVYLKSTSKMEFLVVSVMFIVYSWVYNSDFLIISMLKCYSIASGI